MTVPADHFGASSQTLQVPVYISRAPEGERQEDPIFFLQDGPGEVLYFKLPDFQTFMFGSGPQTRDIVWMESRGLSLEDGQDMTCWPMLDAFQTRIGDDAASAKIYSAGFFTVLSTCLQRVQASGVDFEHFTTEQIAADVASIARTLDYETINLYAVGYGAQVARELLNQSQGPIIRSAFFLSPVPRGLTPERYAQAFTSQLDDLFDTCAADDACNTAFPDLAARFYSELERLAQEPQMVPAAAAPAGLRSVNGTALVNYVFQEMAEGVADLNRLPLLLDRILTGDYALLNQGLSFLRFDLAWGIYAAVQCQGGLDVTLADLGEIGDVQPVLRDFALQRPATSLALSEFCSRVGLKSMQGEVDEGVQSNVPIWVMFGRFDPVAPPEVARSSTTGLTDVEFTQVSDSGRLVSPMFGCGTAAVLRFFEDPFVREDRECGEETLSFQVPLAEVVPSDFVTVRPADLLVTLSVPAFAADELRTKGRFTGLADRGYNLSVRSLPVESLDGLEERLPEFGYLGEPVSTDEQARENGLVWTIYQTSYVTLGYLVAVSQIEDDTVYALEIMYDTIALGDKGLDVKTLRETLLHSMIHSFQPISR